MNKIISTKDRCFISIVGPSASGKTELIYHMLTLGTFYPRFDRIIYFFQHFQSIYRKMELEIGQIEFVPCIDFELINQLPNDGTKFLLIFDDSCEEISRNPKFLQLATSGRHRNLSIIYIKHNLFQQSKFSRTLDLNNTHIILFHSPRDENQISVLGKQLGDVVFLKECYKRATSKPFGHLLIDLSPRTVDLLRYCSDITDETTFYVPSSKAKQTILNDESTTFAYTPGAANF